MINDLEQETRKMKKKIPSSVNQKGNKRKFRKDREIEDRRGNRLSPMVRPGR